MLRNIFAFGVTVFSLNIFLPHAQASTPYSLTQTLKNPY